MSFSWLRQLVDSTSCPDVVATFALDRMQSCYLRLGGDALEILRTHVGQAQPRRIGRDVLARQGEPRRDYRLVQRRGDGTSYSHMDTAEFRRDPNGCAQVVGEAQSG